MTPWKKRAVKVHLSGGFGYTACGMHHQKRLKRELKLTSDPAEVTCGLCRRSPSYKRRVEPRG